MKIKNILNHQRLSMVRSTMWERQLAVKIILGFAIFYLLLNFLVMGFMAGSIIKKALPGSDPVYVFSMGIIFYMVFDLVLRFFWQPVPRLDVAPYLHMNISKKRLSDIIISKTLFNVFNLYPFLIVVPFALREIAFQYSYTAAIGYILGFVLIVIINNLFALHLKLNAQKYFLINFFPIILIIIAIGIHMTDVVNLLTLSAKMGMRFLHLSFVFPILAAHIIIIYLADKRLLVKEMYVDRLSGLKRYKAGSEVSEIKLVKPLGEIGHYIALEIKMMWRNKRPKTLVYMSLIFPIYFAFIFTKGGEQPPFFMSMMGLFLSCPFMLFFGQFMFNWNSTYFDCLMTKNIDLKNFIKAKFYMYLFTSVVFTIMSVIFLYVMKKDVMPFICSALFSIGFISFCLFLFSIYNSSRIDLNRSAFMNYQGTSGMQFLLVFFLMGFTIVFKLILGLFLSNTITYIVMAVTGLILILTFDLWLNWVAQKFIARKYINLEGYRKG